MQADFMSVTSSPTVQSIDITLGHGIVEDIPTLYLGMQALAEHQDLPITITQDELKASLFGDERQVELLVARNAQSENVLGFALYSTRWMTFSGQPVLYMNDIYVDKAARGQGIGKQLIEHLQEIAKQKGCSRLEWHCLSGNQSAQRFYDALGASDDDGAWMTYSI